VQPAFDARWGGAHGMYSKRLGVDRALASNPLAALAAAGLPLALGSDSPVTALDPWGGVRAAVRHHVTASALSARAAFAAHTRGGWRAARRDREGELVPGAPATFAVWQVEGELVVEAPDERVVAWSTDPRAGVPGLPELDGPDPVCLRTVVAGRGAFVRA
jgi:predicted amidohydrolase YtcJ